jgi:DNA polymerase zeta
MSFGGACSSLELKRFVALRTPHFSFAKLTEWFKSGDVVKKSRVLRYWRNRVEMNIEMLDAAEIIDQNW